MPRIAVEDNSRMSLRIRAEEKALLLRAVALEHTDLTDFVLRHVLRHALDAAKAVIEDADHLQFSGRDSLRVLDLLENPPAPNAKLLAAAEVGGVLLVIDAKNETVAEWYASYGAVPMLDAPLSLLLPLATIEAVLKKTGKI